MGPLVYSDEAIIVTWFSTWDVLSGIQYPVPALTLLLPRGNQCYSFLNAGINKYALTSSSYLGFLFVFKEFFLFLCQRLGGICA